MRIRTILAASLATLILAPAASAQFGTPASTSVRERYVGNIVAGSGGTTIVPEAGDQVGAFSDDQLIGVFAFTGDAPGTAYDITASGDDPETPEDEGPTQGDRVRFRYFDLSTNNEIELTALNESGESVNVRFEGQFIPPLPIDLPGFDLTPTRAFDLAPGAPGGGDGGGGGGDGGDAATYDIDGDGDVDHRDVATVLRIYITRASPDSGGGASADVDGDGAVTTRDAIAVQQNK
jgi:hypothetical protein